MKKPFDFTAGVYVVHIGIQNNLEHHFQVKMLDDMVQDAYRVIFCNIFINPLRKKYCLNLFVRNIM